MNKPAIKLPVDEILAGRTFDDVEQMIVGHREVMPHEMLGTFGPQWVYVAEFVRRVADMSVTEVEATAQSADAASSAALALSTRHLIDTNGYTQQHYDLLVAPLAAVIGPVHPDDKPQGANNE